MPSTSEVGSVVRASALNREGVDGPPGCAIGWWVEDLSEVRLPLVSPRGPPLLALLIPGSNPVCSGRRGDGGAQLIRQRGRPLRSRRKPAGRGACASLSAASRGLRFLQGAAGAGLGLSRPVCTVDCGDGTRQAVSGSVGCDEWGRSRRVGMPREAGLEAGGVWATGPASGCVRVCWDVGRWRGRGRELASARSPCWRSGGAQPPLKS